MSKKILITGATGFIGSFLVEKALEKNFEVHVAIRKSSSKQYLQDKKIIFHYLDFSSKEILKKEEYRNGNLVIIDQEIEKRKQERLFKNLMAKDMPPKNNENI